MILKYWKILDNNKIIAKKKIQNDIKINTEINTK